MSTIRSKTIIAVIYAAIFAVLLPITAVAQDTEASSLQVITVTASPLNREISETAQSATVLQADALSREHGNSIGETLSRQPGIHNGSFGQNVGRPVIRGFQGARVGVLNNGITSADASTFSQDHAVPTEPFLLDQVEVIRGPATLVYGSGAIGGVVNMVSGAIPDRVPEDGFEGRAFLQGDSASDEQFGGLRFDFGQGSFSGNFSGFSRSTDDYDIPGEAELFHDEDEGEEEVTGVLENSFVDNEGGSIGGSWIINGWRAGISYNIYDSDYGIPGGHGHEDEHEEEEDEGHDDEEESVSINLENRRIDANLVGENPFKGFENLQLNIAKTDYEHIEFEGEETGTVFAVDTTDLRIELQHNQIGPWQGVFGSQYIDRDFSALGDEAFVPPSVTETGALFLVESAKFEFGRLDLGIRYENVEIESEVLEHGHEEEEGEEEELEISERDFNPLSLSAAAVVDIGENDKLIFTFANAERAPSDFELFSNGPHLATQTFDIGDSGLDIETNRHYEIAYRLNRGPVSGNVSIYYDDFKDFIFQAGTDLEEDGLPVRRWSQQNAEFIGGEIDIRWDLGETLMSRWQLFGFYDWVEAELDNGSNVPLIPPHRIGFGVDWDYKRWKGNVTWIHADDHSDIADFETPTPGYDLLNAEVSYKVRQSKLDFTLFLFLKGKNLLDEEIRYSTSNLKDLAPQIGRNIVAGARINF